MNLSRFKIRLSFRAKILAPVVTVMVLVFAVATWLINQRISTQLHEQAVRELDTTRKILLNNQKITTANLLAQYRHVLAELPLRPVTQDTNVTTIQVLPTNAMRDLMDANGVGIATFSVFKNGVAEAAPVRIGPGLDANEFARLSAVAIEKAAAGEAQADTICLGSKLYNVVALPVRVGDRTTNETPAGVLACGVEVPPEEAREIQQLTGSELLFVSGGKVLASSSGRPGFETQLAARFNELAVGDSTSNSGKTTELSIGGGHYLCQADYFPSLSGDKKIGYVLLSSNYGQSGAVLKKTQQMRRVVGLSGLALSVVIVWFLVGRVTRPLRQLRDSAEAVGRGDYSQRVKVSSHDECGELAEVFNRMTENIQASREQLETTVESLKTTQNQLIQSEKLSGIGEFVAGVAHELNNPLTSVMGFAELLQQMDMPEQSRRYLDMIFKSAKRCQKIVASLLSFARRHAPERKVVCVNEIVESAVEILNYQMRTSNIEVITQLDPNLPATEVDSHQMQQVFLNIINNARQAMEANQEKGWLRITTESSGHRVRIIFQDNGPGILPENLTKIFNPFFTTKEVGKGTGLGLSLCYGIVSEHGGTIAPFSKEGEGATFVIELPISQALATAAEKKATVVLPAQSKSEGVGKRVLVIDDEDTILQMIREILERNGYRVDVARDGEAALRRLGQYHYDLALCDWKMPGLNGQQIYERLQSVNPDMSRRVIFITGDTVNEKTQEFLREQHKICLSKPFTLGEFRSAINRVIVPGRG